MLGAALMSMISAGLLSAAALVSMVSRFDPPAVESRSAPSLEFDVSQAEYVLWLEVGLR